VTVTGQAGPWSLVAVFVLGLISEPSVRSVVVVVLLPSLEFSIELAGVVLSDTVEKSVALLCVDAL
jgi:hypothetical protein